MLQIQGKEKCKVCKAILQILIAQRKISCRGSQAHTTSPPNGGLFSSLLLFYMVMRYFLKVMA
jgi:hypothetical protein